METPKQIKENEAEEARLRQAEPMHVPGHPETVIRDPVEHGWTIIERPVPIKPAPPPKPPKPHEYAPNVRHINRYKYQAWLGSAITKPLYVREAT